MAKAFKKFDKKVKTEYTETIKDKVFLPDAQSVELSQKDIIEVRKKRER